MINQHAEQFHRILVKAGLRKPESTALDHDLAERERRMVRPLDAPPRPTIDPLALRPCPQDAPGSTIAPDPTQPHRPPIPQPPPSPDADDPWATRKDLA